MNFRKGALIKTHSNCNKITKLPKQLKVVFEKSSRLYTLDSIYIVTIPLICENNGLVSFISCQL